MSPISALPGLLGELSSFHAINRSIAERLHERVAALLADVPLVDPRRSRAAKYLALFDEHGAGIKTVIDRMLLNYGAPEEERQAG